MKNNIISAIMGACVADALGVPVEFENRETLIESPVTSMRGYGTHNQKAGTWSDDTSMTLCLIDSLSKGLDYQDIMTKFLKWINEGEYTAHGKVFDVGNATRKALRRFEGELYNYKRLNDKSFSKIPVNNIKSSGYVVDTLEAAIWCLLNTKSYKDCVLLAVNLGEDTDTVAAVAGGLAGLYYGYDDIPKEWLEVIAKREYIENLCKELSITLGCGR